MRGDRLQVEVVDARPEAQRVVRLVMEEGSTVRDAVERSGLDPQGLGGAVGVHGRAVRADRRLREGDRVDLLRPLVADPKEARRARARGRRRGGRR